MRLSRELKEPSIDLENAVLHIVQKVLNSIPTTRIVYRQEAMMEIAKLPLTTCSEQLVPVYAIGYYRIGKTLSSHSLMSQYAHRKDNHNQSFVQFFYNKCNSSKSSKQSIMNICGLNGNPVYPVTYDYARAIMIFYKPWRGLNRDLLQDQQQVIQDFKEYVESDYCPLAVKQAYVRAKFRYESGRAFQDDNKKEEEYEHHLNTENIDDEELKRYIEFSNSFQRATKDFSVLHGYKLNIGYKYNWSKPNIDTEGKDWLTSQIAAHDQWNELSLIDDGVDRTKRIPLDIPLQSNGSKYTTDKLKGTQKVAVAAILDNLRHWIDYSNGKESTYNKLRMTVLGKGGTGKSFLINTIVSEIRQYFQANESVLIVAPTGTAAYNVGGQTLHREFGISIYPNQDMSNKSKEKLRLRLKKIVTIIIDERSMITNSTINDAEKHLRELAYKGLLDNFDWGAVPIILVVGDDYQLPPIGNGVINGFWNVYKESTKNTKQVLESDLKGFRLFLNLTKSVIELTKSHRHKEGESNFQTIRDEVRKGIATRTTAQQLMSLHHANYKPEDWEQIEKDATYIFANKEPVHQHNSKMLAKLSNEKNPVANIVANLIRVGDTKKKPTWRHFDANNVVKHTPICIGAKVAIKGKNFYPKWGLHNGAMGTVKEIAFEVGKNPNNGDLPEYVVVHFEKLNLPCSVKKNCKEPVRKNIFV